jgi:hypothetical protein
MSAPPDDQSVVLDREADRDKSHESSGPESVARSALGRRASTTIGLVTAAIYGIRSIRAGFVPRASTSGLRRIGLSVAAGLPIPIGTRSEKRASILSNRILLHLTTLLYSLFEG